MSSLLIITASAVAISVITAYACIQYATIKYGSSSELANTKKRLDKFEKHVKMYENDRLHERLTKVENITGSGFDIPRR